jgi:hypothetical protein
VVAAVAVASGGLERTAAPVNASEPRGFETSVTVSFPDANVCGAEGFDAHWGTGIYCSVLTG